MLKSCFTTERPGHPSRWALQAHCLAASSLLSFHPPLPSPPLPPLSYILQDSGDFASVAYFVLKTRCPEKGRYSNTQQAHNVCAIMSNHGS